MAVAVRRAHLAIGLVGLAGFFASGLYMDLQLDHLRGLEAETRLLYRSTHIYLLLTALMNLLLGLYVTPLSGWRAGAQWLGSSLVVVAPVLAGLAFAVEPSLVDLARPYSTPALYAALVGSLVHAAASIRPKLSGRGPGEAP